jgi:hypothetical protein
MPGLSIDTSDLIGAAEAATILRVSRPTLWRLTKAELVPVVAFIPQGARGGVEMKTAVYSRQRMIELRKEWDTQGWKAPGIHIKRRLDKQKSTDPEAE